MLNIWTFTRKHLKIILLYVFSIVAVCLLLPLEGRFPYEFKTNVPWGHEDLYAPFDFPINKTPDELLAEQDSLSRSFVTYYDEHPEVLQQQKRHFNQVFNEQWTERNRLDDRNRLYQAVITYLDFVYHRGIFQADETTPTQSQSNRAVIIRNNIRDDVDNNSILTNKAAYELLIANLERVTSHDDFMFLKGLNLNNFIQSNLTINTNITNAERQDRIERMSATKGVFSANRLIIAHGENITEEKFNLLDSFKDEFKKKIGDSGNLAHVRIGQAIIVIVFYVLIFAYLMYFRIEIFKSFRRTSFLLLMSLLFIGIACVVVRNDYFNLYMLPFVFIPLVVCTFYDARIANFVYWIIILQIAFIVPNSFEFVFLNFVAGFVGLVNVKSIYRRGSLFRSISFVILVYCLAYTALALMQGNNIIHIDWMNYVRFAISGTLVFVIYYPSIFIFEKIFGFISDITLMELSDTNQPLLRKISEVTPSTFQHSLQVGNLAEEVVRNIGGNPLLVRTGALYHDVGKSVRPEYFTENQTNTRSPHEGLTPEESAQVIIEHVTAGIEIARKKGLPQHIIDFIPTHHGTGIVRYFYVQQQKLFPDQTIDRAKFSYPGPPPFSKETVALMMCDSIEAASRSLKEVSQQSISDLVDNIVNYQIQEGQYNAADITYREINKAKQVIKNRLMNIYHVRIEYPK